MPHEEILPGIWRFRLGAPESVSPVGMRRHQPKSGAAAGDCPVSVAGRATDRGYVVSIPLGPYEQVYGFGLQLQSFAQRGTKKTLRVNADPRLDSGDTHAPVPFYVTTAGYGVLVDTARYATFYCGNNQRDIARSGDTDETLPAAYRAKGLGAPSDMLVEVPRAAGVDVYVFAGPSMRDAIARYNLFSGGGALPPVWGLGVWYRTHLDFTQDEVLDLAARLRERQMPCDVIGLEPGWQTRSYSCSYVWSDKFPDPRAMIDKLRQQNFRLNLWEHAFVHPDSPIHEAMRPHSGDFAVWGGSVPDFCAEPATRIFADLHRSEHIELGVSGYKLDECDNSDYTGGWSFPELSQFPSGVDGEQMHSLFGLRYMDAIEQALDGRRSYGLVRSAHALAAPYPYVLYSDLYDHREFVRALVNSGFSGLLWTPELRHAADVADLVRRLQTAVLSPMAHINAWYIRNPPWLQVDRAANNAGDLAPNWERAEELCRQALQLRMRLVPYLQAAFVRYQNEGVPPFRALVVDYPDDPETWSIDDQYLMGEAFLVAPLFASETQRSVYLPAGDWFDFWTGTQYAGGQWHVVAASLETLPLFVRSGSAIPLAAPTDHVLPEPDIEVRTYGPDAPDAVTIYRDDESGPAPIRLHRNGSWTAI